MSIPRARNAGLLLAETSLGSAEEGDELVGPEAGLDCSAMLEQLQGAAA